MKYEDQETGERGLIGRDMAGVEGRGSQALQDARARVAEGSADRLAYHQMLADLLCAILGEHVVVDEANFDRQIHRATLERARLLFQIERVQETIAQQASSIDSQQRLITDMSAWSIRGKVAYDAMMQVAVKIGINPVPADPEQLSAALIAAFGAAPTERMQQS